MRTLNYSLLGQRLIDAEGWVRFTCIMPLWYALQCERRVHMVNAAAKSPPVWNSYVAPTVPIFWSSALRRHEQAPHAYPVG